MDNATRTRTRLSTILAVLVITYWLALFAATHVPLQPVKTKDGPSYDKLMHLAAYCGLAILACAAGGTRFGVSWKLYAGVFVVIAIYGLLDEVSQSLVRDREADVRDWLADLVGTCLGVSIFAAGRSLIRRRAAVRP